MTPVSLYITAANREEAISIARELLANHMIACANIVDHATSLYWWQGEIEHTTESLLIVKSLASHVKAITEKVKSLHSYDCPCIIATPITDGNPDYIKWLQEQVKPLPVT